MLSLVLVCVLLLPTIITLLSYTCYIPKLITKYIFHCLMVQCDTFTGKWSENEEKSYSKEVFWRLDNISNRTQELIDNRYIGTGMQSAVYM